MNGRTNDASGALSTCRERGLGVGTSEGRPAPTHVSLVGYQKSVQPLDVVVKELREELGAPLVAYIAGVKETRAVHEWAEGTREVRGHDREQRLRIALRVAVTLREAADVEEVGRQVLNAAQAFSAVG